MKLKDILKQSLNIGAIKTDDFVHNGGWYNGKGEYLGWGDLSKEDLHNVAANIPEGEQLFVLKERDRLGQLNVDYHYLLEKCVVVVVKDGV